MPLVFFLSFYYLLAVKVSRPPASLSRPPMFKSSGANRRQRSESSSSDAPGRLSSFYFILFYIILVFFNEIRPCQKRKQKYLGLSERFPGRSCQNRGRTDVWSSSKPKPEKSVVSFCRGRRYKRLLETDKKKQTKKKTNSKVRSLLCCLTGGGANIPQCRVT